MDLVGTLPASMVAVLLIAASPGPAMTLIVRRAARRRRQRSGVSRSSG